MQLSDAKCRTARAQERPYKLADGHGLYLLVAKNGSRLWRLDYRFDRKRLTMALGSYPEVSLAEARQARETARKQLREGLNPAAIAAPTQDGQRGFATRRRAAA